MPLLVGINFDAIHRENAMKLGITGAAGRLGRALCDALAHTHQIRAMDIAAAGTPPGTEPGDVLDPGDAAGLCAGCDAVIHLARADWSDARSAQENEATILDTRLKGTYNVLQAAASAGVRRVIQVSDLCLYSGYDASICVQEDFVPLPDTSAEQQSVYLSELIGREFSRQHPGLVLTLRLGKLVEARALAADTRFEPSWLAMADAVGAIGRGLEVDRFDGLSHWGLYNLAADVPGGRFCLHKIRNGEFAFTPQERFASWRREATP
jgi:nucleoside-diphosphate-sugar epimerase